MLRDPDCKKPKLSLRILTQNLMSSSYRIGASASRKWDEDFLREPAVQPTHALHPLPGKKSPLGPHAAVDQFIAAGMDQFSVAASNLWTTSGMMGRSLP